MTAPESKRRWYRPTPGRLVALLLIVEGLLWVSGWFQWLPKGYTVLLAVASVGVVLVTMLLWFLVALVFRLRFQFTLRTMLVLTVAVALPFSWLAVEMKRAREQRDLVDEIQKGGGNVIYDWRLDTNHAFLPNAQPKRPLWLRDLLEDDFFGEVASVYFVGSLSQFTEARQGRLRRLNQIKRLMLFGYSEQATDTDLKCLTGLPKLRELYCFTNRDPSSEMQKLQQALPNCEVRVIFDIQETPRTPVRR